MESDYKIERPVIVTSLFITLALWNEEIAQIKPTA
jgi:hypothetical protein